MKFLGASRRIIAIGVYSGFFVHERRSHHDSSDYIKSEVD